MPQSLLVRYYLYRATMSVGFISPIFTLFLLRTLTFTQVGLLSALYAVLTVVGEIPTGYVGDRFGRRVSLILSIVFSVLSLAGFVIAESFTWFVLLYVLWALAITFRSGSADAWLYDALDEHLDTESFSQVRGRGGAVTQWTGAVTMIAGGVLYTLDPRYPFLAAIVLNALGVVVLLSLPESGGSDDGEHLTVVDALPLLRAHFTSPPLREFVLYVGLFLGGTIAANVYIQPMAVETIGPSFEALGQHTWADPIRSLFGSQRPTAIALGVLYASFAGISAIGSYHAGTLHERLGLRRALVLIPVGTAVALLVPTQLALFAIPAFVTMRAAQTLVQPLANQYLNDQIASTGRATVLSAASMVYATVRAPLALLAGVVADATSATVAVAVLGAIFLLGGAVLALVGSPLPQASHTAGRHGQ